MTHKQIREILEKVTYKDWRFELQEVGGDEIDPAPLALQLVWDAYYPGNWQRQASRRWLLECETEDDVLRTALLAVLTAEEHEARETFTYQGRHIFGPHKRHAAAVA